MKLAVFFKITGAGIEVLEVWERELIDDSFIAQRTATLDRADDDSISVLEVDTEAAQR